MSAKQGQTAPDRSALPLRIPVLIGRTRLRGNAVGALVDEQPGEDHLGQLRTLLMDEARAAGVDATPNWLSNATIGLLRLYEQSQAAWSAKKDGCIGHVFEASMPS